MCGIFGFANQTGAARSSDLKVIAKHAARRGTDSSGMILFSKTAFEVVRADLPIGRVMSGRKFSKVDLVVGHSRLITNGNLDNQPVVYPHVSVFHNGIVLNEGEIWPNLPSGPNLEIDTEVIAALVDDLVANGESPFDATRKMLDACTGAISAVLVFPKLGKLIMCSNTGDMHIGRKQGVLFFSSERHPLIQIGCAKVTQVREIFEVEIDSNLADPLFDETRVERPKLVHQMPSGSSGENLLRNQTIDLRRCASCILPETMPFIRFNSEGICNYCENYRPRVVVTSKELLGQSIEDQLTQTSTSRLIFPFSGGRDSSYALQYLVREMDTRPITYTYDWGMLTDLGRRNISLLCSELGVENVLVAANIEKKRMNIRRNLLAWLERPHLGMVNLLTAGDKHFFQHVLKLKSELNSPVNLWSFNPLETTHFKTGFLGIRPSFESPKVYQTGLAGQVRYQATRFKVMLSNPKYFNSSIWDTLSGEFFRSVVPQNNYLQFFDFVRWEETEVNTVLSEMGWETAIDTPTTWRIGDGTAAFYNYVFFTLAGFTEHDTFRSNQIREGQISRSEALERTSVENRPRYQNIRWYLDAVGLEFGEVIRRVNQFALAR